MEVAGILAIYNIVKIKAKERDKEFHVTEGKPALGELENIISKPDLEFFGQPSKYNNPIKKAACLMEGIVRIHPFTDGNKRTALYASYVYLQKENITLDLKQVESSFLIYIATNEAKTEDEIDMLIDEIEVYLNQRIKK